jgi:hypothetical protein
VYCLQPPQLADALCPRHYDEVARRAQQECVEITDIESVGACLFESPERRLFTSLLFHEKLMNIKNGTTTPVHHNNTF